MFLLIAAIAGCGDSSDGSDATGSAEEEIVIPWGPSEVYYVKRANSLCKQVWSEIQSGVAQRYPTASQGELFNEAAQNIILPSVQILFDDLSFQGAPPEDKAQIEDMLIAMQVAIFSGQEQTVTSPEQLATIFDEYNQLAREYELDRCLVEKENFSAT